MSKFGHDHGNGNGPKNVRRTVKYQQEFNLLYKSITFLNTIRKFPILYGLESDLRFLMVGILTMMS